MVLSRSSTWSLAAMFLLAWTATPARAAEGATFTMDVAAALGPGQFLWNDTGGTGDIRILVSIPLQRAYVYRGDALIGLSPISSGAPGFDTPVGAFTILEKDADHRSNIYSNAPMPFMLRLTWDGIALHAGRNPGYPASHGCVRLPVAFARKLFSIISLGAQVIVTDDYTDPLSVPRSPDMTIASARAVPSGMLPLDIARRAAASAIAWTAIAR
ncbi:L,D-transpeptidase family protein [Sphingomonas sp. QA11]|uniref:L,D-transpeptidase family protein n=1 Tax=Sphingomonas sp. QA11 TaxID=2950605 RepID=UPI00234BA45E|nr:L,D-transpeptidase family protein [Sphingomonas sp. QA11]WCM27290.1 L,D-transpeptidase family protein [Sphingomonas sp. QA11]